MNKQRRPIAVYSPGGCGCGLLLLPVVVVSIGVMFALAGTDAAMAQTAPVDASVRRLLPTLGGK